MLPTATQNAEDDASDVETFSEAVVAEDRPPVLTDTKRDLPTSTKEIDRKR